MNWKNIENGLKGVEKNMKDPNAIPRSEMTLSNVKEKDVDEGDIWWVNFPFEEEEQRDENGDSTVGKIRPALVISKVDNDERSIILVKGTTSRNDKYTNPKNIEYIGRLRFDCSKIAKLAPHHLLEYWYGVYPENYQFQQVCNRVMELGKANETILATYEQAMLEAKLKADERTDYGLPKKKKYPMPDEAHVLQAIRMFNHCDPKDEAELARNIKKYMKKYNMKDVKVGKNNRFSKYYHTKAINEEVKMWGYEIRAMVNESLRLLEMSGGGGPMIGMEINDQSVQYSSPGQFIITTKDKDSGVDYGVTNDIKSKYLYRKDKDKGYVKEDMESYLKDKDYKIYQYTGDIDIWKYMLSDIQYNSYDEDTTIYEDLTGRKQLSYDQIDFDENFRYYNIKQVLLESSILNATTKSKLDELKGKKTHLFNTNIKVSDKFSVAESVDGYCLRYGDYHSDFVSLDELAKIYNI